MGCGGDMTRPEVSNNSSQHTPSRKVTEANKSSREKGEHSEGTTVHKGEGEGGGGGEQLKTSSHDDSETHVW